MKRSPLPIPQLNRVDVRTYQSLNEVSPTSQSNETETMNHSFAKSEVWQQVLNSNHPILKHHKAFDQHLLPGLAYIDLLYQWFGELGYEHQQLELRNLSIFRPLIVEDKRDIELFIQAVEKDSGFWKVTVKGKSVNKDGELGTEETLITAECHKLDKMEFEEQVDLNACIGEAKQDLEEMYNECRKLNLVHTDLMKGQGIVSVNETETWIQISVAQDSNETADKFLFHPVLIDGSGVGSMKTIAGMVKDEERLFLPLFFESFRAVEPLQTECITRIKHEGIRLENELIKSTMEFFNASGQKIGELKNFNNKLVREKELITEKPKQRKANKQHPTISADFDSMESFIQSLIASKLDKPTHSVDTNAGYYEMGLDSAMLLEVVQEIEAQFSLSLPPTLLFEHTTIASLADHLSNDYSGDIQFKSVTKASTKPSKKAHSTALPKQDAVQPLPTHAPGAGASRQAVQTSTSNRDIAVIGMAGRYPQADNINEFWNNLKAGKDCITDIPEDRWDWKQFESTTFASGKSVSKWGGFVNDVDCFDPLFFRISPLEAEALDPQERTFLEVCWEAMEDAGYTPNNIVQPRGEARRKLVGVFAGVMHKDYTLVEADANAQGQQIPLSLNYAQIANRVSYFCDFHGPSTAVDTVCSSSLTAVHLAINSLILEECEVAFAGGVNLSLHPDKYETYGMVNLHSSDGRCRAFGEGGDGYVSGEGIGAVLLKPLEKAVGDGDHIYAVIKGSNVNHVGSVSGFTVPSPVAQAELIADCLEKAKVEPESISYIETHGTGTALGDPIEIQGLIKAFGKNTAKKQFCALGSVKSNIGHAESAAGISGMTKAILQLHHKQLVPSIHCDPINPHLNLETSPFYVQKENEEWNPEQGVRRAGISSFGATGSNAHVILEEFHQEETIRKELETPVLLPLSAKTQERLQAYVLKLLDFIQMNQHEIDLPSMAYTLQTGRQDMDERFVVLAGSIDEVIEKLKEFVKKPEQASGIWCGNINSENTLLRFFQSDGDLKDAVEQWLLKGKLNKVAELWVQGCEMEWELLYEEERPLRMSLPTYPFTRERYWVNVDVNRPAVQVDPETKDVKIEVRLPESMEAGRTNSSKNNNNVASLGRANKKAAETNNTQSGGLAAQTKGIEKVDTKAHIREIVASTIKLKPEQVLYNKALYEYGVDSIIFMKLNNFFEENFDTTFTMTEWDEKWSIEQIFQELEKKAGDLSLKTVGPTETVQEVKDLAPRKSASHSGSIPKVTREHYPLSSTQKSLYFLYLSAPKEPFYNMSVTYQLTGELNELALKQTLEEIIDRHDALKTKFVLVKGEAFQTVPEENQLEIKQVDLHDLAESERKQRLDQELYDESLQAFDLEKELPIRALLIRTGSNEHYLRLTSHHIVFDGWSMGVFSYEFGALYNAFANGRPSPLSPLPVQYPDYAVYQQETLLTARDYPQHLEFWKEKLKSVTNGTLLPADREREGNVGFEGGTLVFTLEKEKVERLRKLGSENSASLFMTLLAAFQTLLFRYTGDKDIVIGSPIANRLTTDLERMIGFFANSLVMRGQLLDYMSFTDLLDETRKMVKEAYEHKDVPFEALVAELKPERNINFNPFFQIAFVLQNAPFQELEMHELTVNRLDDQAPKVRFDLEVNLFETDGAIEGFFNYRTSLFEKERIERLMEHYGNLLDAILVDTNTPLIKLRFLGKEEQEQSAIKIDQIKRDPVAEVASTPSESIEFERGTI